MSSARDGGGSPVSRSDSYSSSGVPAFKRAVPPDLAPSRARAHDADAADVADDTHESTAAKILVAVRCRPLNPREKACGHDELVKVMDNRMVVVLDKEAPDRQDVLRANRSREKRYVFDHAFNKFATQEEVYESTTRGLINGVMAGYNATVFAYGATGTGKTYTMIGTPTSPGLMVLTMQVRD